MDVDNGGCLWPYTSVVLTGMGLRRPGRIGLRHWDRDTFRVVDVSFSARGRVERHAVFVVILGGWTTKPIFIPLLLLALAGCVARADVHPVSQQHLRRYLCEFDFRYNARSGLGVNDAARAQKAIKGIVVKRMTYRRTDEASHA